MLIACLNTLLILWAVFIYFYFIAPLLNLYLSLRKSKLSCSLNLFKQRIKVIIDDQKVFVSIVRRWKNCLVTVHVPLESAYAASFTTKLNKNNNFFLFVEKNIFISKKKTDYLTELEQKRNQFLPFFTQYMPAFAQVTFRSLTIDYHKTSIQVVTNNTNKIISCLQEAVMLGKETNHQLNNLLAQQQSLNFYKSEAGKKILAHKKMIIVLLIASIAIAITGGVIIFYNRQPAVVEQKQIMYEKYIQIWEINQKYATVYDVRQLPNGKIELISAPIKKSLTEFGGFKPELEPWGFRVLPQKNAKKHYKILILPKDTEFLGFINYKPIQTIKTDNCILIYDLSTITQESFIKIYMRYQGEITPFDLKTFNPENPTWKSIF